MRGQGLVFGWLFQGYSTPWRGGGREAGRHTASSQQVQRRLVLSSLLHVCVSSRTHTICMYVKVHLSVQVCVEARGWHREVFLNGFCTLLFETVSLNLSESFWPDWQWVPVGSMYLPFQSGMRHTLSPLISVGAGNQDYGPYACSASALPTELLPSTPVSFLLFRTLPHWWCHPHSRWLFPLVINFSEKVFLNMPRCVSMVTLKPIKPTKVKTNHCSYHYAVICPLQKQLFMAQRSTLPESDMTAQAYDTCTQAADTGLEVWGQPGQIQGQPKMYSETLPKKV